MNPKPGGSKEAIEISNNLTKLFNSEGGSSKVANEALIVGPIVLGGIGVFLVVMCCCAMGNRPGDRGGKSA